MLPCNQNTGDIHLILKWLNKDRVELLQNGYTILANALAWKCSTLIKQIIPEYLIIPLVFHLHSNLSTSSSKVPCRGCNASYKIKKLLFLIKLIRPNVKISNCTIQELNGYVAKSPFPHRGSCHVPMFLYVGPRPTSNFLLTNCSICISPPEKVN